MSEHISSKRADVGKLSPCLIIHSFSLSYLLDATEQGLALRLGCDEMRKEGWRERIKQEENQRGSYDAAASII